MNRRGRWAVWLTVGTSAFALLVWDWRPAALGLLVAAGLAVTAPKKTSE